MPQRRQQIFCSASQAATMQGRHWVQYVESKANKSESLSDLTFLIL